MSEPSDGDGKPADSDEPATKPAEESKASTAKADESAARAKGDEAAKAKADEPARPATTTSGEPKADVKASTKAVDDPKPKPAEPDPKQMPESGKPKAAEDKSKTVGKKVDEPPTAKDSPKSKQAAATATAQEPPKPELPKAQLVGGDISNKPTAGIAPRPTEQNSPAAYLKGYETHKGQLEITATELVFSTKKKDRAGVFAVGGLVALAAVNPYERLLGIPLSDIKSVKASDKRSDQLDIETPTETLSFRVENRPLWLRAFAGEPLVEPGELDLHAPLTYPDDGPLSRRIRKLDTRLGQLEQFVLVAILACVVLTAASHALLDRFAGVHVPFKEEVIRAGTFAIALLGAAFASHQARHLSMDLISRRFSPRRRLFLKIALALFTILIVAIFIRAGFHVIAVAGSKAEEHVLSSERLAYLIPIGGVLIILHTVLHTIIDVDYILRRKTPPERMRSAH